MSGSFSRLLRVTLVGVLVLGALTPLRTPGAAAATSVTLPPGFAEQIVFSGLTLPTNLEFSPDGRVFVTEKAGIVKVFDDLADATPTVVADLSGEVFANSDRGLLGFTLAPGFPTNPWAYVLYAYGVPLHGVTPPKEDCSDVTGGVTGGACIVSARLSRFKIEGDAMVAGSEEVLVNDWCQQFSSHSIGDLHFGQDGMLYVSAGDGANYSNVDYGQLGAMSNPCGDPVKEGGALRAQDLLSGGDSTGLSGSILRLDPVTGAAAAGNPVTTGDDNARRIVAEGLRNPFRFTMKPGTNEVWVGDVGWNTWEEINRIPDPKAGLTNFGWP
jgi:glucose/arabinose dehydrogenase